jgi:hypothetical protein
VFELSAEQEASREEFRKFADEVVAPHAAAHDSEERLRQEVIDALVERGYLASFLPPEQGGAGLDFITYGLLTEELGRACSSTRSLLTVHDMLTLAIRRWGNEEQRSWLPRLARGEVLGAFALSEPEVGSDAKSVSTTAEAADGAFVVHGTKKWITFGQIADLFVVFVRCEEGPTALLVERDTPGLTIEPLGGVLGTRGSMLAQLRFEDCRVPEANLLGRVGFGFTHVASAALDLGRYSVACGSVGIGQACLDASMDYASERVQFGAAIKQHQLVRRMLTDMLTQVRAARLLCLRAGTLKQQEDPRGTLETLIAKYFASTTAVRVASDAVQIHGANGCTADYPVARLLRDAKVMEIIEGSTQIQQVAIARYGELDLRG